MFLFKTTVKHSLGCESEVASFLPETIKTEEEAVQYLTNNGHTNFELFQSLGKYVPKKPEVVVEKVS